MRLVREVPQPSETGPWRALTVGVVLVLLTLIHKVDAGTGAAPFQHLYYVPIVIAAIGLAPYGGVIAAIGAVVLYHLANPGLLAFAYRESDIVQIALFLAIGLVTAKLADDARRLRRVAETDDLTGLYNLRGFEERLTKAIAIARRTRVSAAMLVLDLDRLKSLNDRYGHLAGADAVRTVGHLIARNLPDGAFACRFGGDEFVVALPGHSLDAATAVAGAVREAVNCAAPALAGIAFPAHTLSVSVGVAVASVADGPAAKAGEALFRAADEALYAAKAGGRNQTRLAAS